MRYLACLIVLLGLILSSCTFLDPEKCTIHVESTAPIGTIQKYQIIIDSRMPANKVGLIIDAAAEWSITTNGAITFNIIYTSFNYDDVPALETIHVYQGPNVPKPTSIGLTWYWNVDSNGRPGRSRIWFDETLTEHKLFLVMLHEFGHAFGLPHYTGDLDSIMHPAPIPAFTGDKPACYDKQTICKIWNCNSDC